jgi:hypothetical protein
MITLTMGAKKKQRERERTEPTYDREEQESRVVADYVQRTSQQLPGRIESRGEGHAQVTR